MEERLKSILESNADLEEYFNEFNSNSEFLYHYFIQNPERILSNNYLFHSDKLSANDLIKLAEFVIQKNSNDEILSKVFDSLSRNAWKDEIEIYIQKIFKYIDEGQIDIEKINDYLKGRYYKNNPMKAVAIDINNIAHLGKVNNEEFQYIVELAKNSNYVFSHNDGSFLRENVYENSDNFIYFVNNSKYDEYIAGELQRRFLNFSKEELHDMFKRCNNEYMKQKILEKYNHNNYDINSIIKEERIYLIYNQNKEQVLDFLEVLKSNNIQSDIVIQMPRVDLEFIDEAEKIIGDKLRISPMLNQNRNNIISLDKVDATLPDYDVDYIRQSEQKLDMYAKTVLDQLDRDGDLKSLSPLEKFAAAYLIVTKFAPYKHENNTDTADTSRAVYEFINKDGDIKIVCAGYANLLLELLHRMGFTGITYWSVAGENKDNTMDDHARIMIHLVDPKYGIDGIYMSDPTWDSDTLNNTRFRHMLMSHDELLKIDPNDVTLKGLHADDDVEIGNKLGVDNAHELFRKPIPREALIKAYLALEHFLDRNMKMTSEYTKLEYNEMAKKMGFKEEMQDLSFDELIRMPYKDMMTLLEMDEEKKLDFMIELKNKMSDYFTNKGITIPFKTALTYIFVPFDKESELYNEILATNKYEFDDGKISRFIIHKFDELSIFDSLPIIEQKLFEYQELLEKLTNNMGENRNRR